MDFKEPVDSNIGVRFKNPWKELEKVIELRIRKDLL